MKAGLYLIGTPIGNLEDITLRALATLQGLDYLLAEDTRHSLRLLQRHQIRVELVSCHRFNEAARTEQVLQWLAQGCKVGLVTNAGMPGISDPGARITTACRQAGFSVTVIPGPSAVATAVALSGYGGHGHLFEGFLPRRAGQRRRRLETLLREELPVVLFESPYRYHKLLEELNELAPSREIFIGRELTKLHEECIWGTATEIGTRWSQVKIRGELTLVLSPFKNEAASQPAE